MTRSRPASFFAGNMIAVKRFAYRLASLPIARRRFNGALIWIPWGLRTAFPAFGDIAYEKEEWEALELCGKEGGTFLDIGASVGILSILMSRIAGPTGRVIAFEPHPDTHCVLRAVLRGNHCNNASAIQAAVLDKCTVTTFFLSPVGSLGVRSSVVSKDPGGQEIVVPALSIDAICQARDLKVDYVKIDAEGAENGIVCGAANTIEKCRPCVQIEVHGQLLGIQEVATLFQMMAEHRYIAVNIPTWTRIDAGGFGECTHCHAPDTFTGADMSFRGYGQVLFVPEEKRDLLKKIAPRKCQHCAVG
jgi:FkbM family methyltransferase